MRQHYALLTPAHPGYPNAGVSLVGLGGPEDHPWVGRVSGINICSGPTADLAMEELRRLVASGVQVDRE